MADPIPAAAARNKTKSIRCTECDRQLLVTYRSSQPPPDEATAISCPFCDHKNIVDIDGKVASVVAQDLRKPM